MTVKLLRAYDGHDAGMAYTGDPDVEADLVKNGNAVDDPRAVLGAPVRAPVAAQEPEPEPAAKPAAKASKAAKVSAS